MSLIVQWRITYYPIPYDKKAATFLNQNKLKSDVRFMPLGGEGHTPHGMKISVIYYLLNSKL